MGDYNRKGCPSIQYVNLLYLTMMQSCLKHGVEPERLDHQHYSDGLAVIYELVDPHLVVEISEIRFSGQNLRCMHACRWWRRWPYLSDIEIWEEEQALYLSDIFGCIENLELRLKLRTNKLHHQNQIIKIIS
jgi:hypothetical protein